MPEPARRPPPPHPAGLDGRINFAPARVIGLSFGGALVETHDWFGLGHRVTLRIAQPPVQVLSSVVRSRLVRVEPADGRPVYQATLRFDDSAGIRPQLAGLMTTLARAPVEEAVPA